MSTTTAPHPGAPHGPARPARALQPGPKVGPAGVRQVDRARPEGQRLRAALDHRDGGQPGVTGPGPARTVPRGSDQRRVRLDPEHTRPLREPGQMEAGSTTDIQDARSGEVGDGPDRRVDDPVRVDAEVLDFVGPRIPPRCSGSGSRSPHPRVSRPCVAAGLRLSMWSRAFASVPRRPRRSPGGGRADAARPRLTEGRTQAAGAHRSAPRALLVGSLAHELDELDPTGPEDRFAGGVRNPDCSSSTSRGRGRRPQARRSYSVMLTSRYDVPSGSSTVRYERRVGSCQQTSGLSRCGSAPERIAAACRAQPAPP